MGGSDRITVPRPDLSYALAVLAVALVSVLVPAVYLGLVGLLAWGVWWYAVHAVSVMGAGGFTVLALAAYFAPLGAGVAAILLMLQPLCAGRQPAVPPITLTRDREPASLPSSSTSVTSPERPVRPPSR